MPVKKPNDKFPFKTLTPRFDSDLTRLILKLEPYRNENFRNGATPNVWLEGLKAIFFILESVASARIEGNRTTVAEYVASVENETPEDASPERIREIGNLVAGLKFIEEQLGDGAASQMAIRELHKIAVSNLNVANEGDRTPGDYRKTNVRIANSKHTPPDAGDVPSYVARLVDWLNEPSDDLYDLIKIAQSHWAFVWIHPFGNGNGRAARLFTYALLRKYGFVPDGLIVNPNGLFCAEREKYYRFLELADSGRESDVEAWCVFFLRNLHREIKNAKRLTRKEFVVDEIFKPAFDAAFRANVLTKEEVAVLTKSLELETIRLKDVAQPLLLPESACSRTMKKLRERGLLVATKPGGRIYRFNLAPVLYRFVIQRFHDLKLTPLRLTE